MPYRLLIAEDDPHMAGLLAELGAEAGFMPRTAATGGQAAAMLASGEFDALATDLRMPGLDGIELLRLARQHDAEMPVVMITGYATTQNAVDAFHQGVFDIVLKPFNTDATLAILCRVHDFVEHRLRLEQLRTRLRQLENDVARPLVASRPMREVTAILERVADADIPVLLTGETGTGKGVFARFLHELSARRTGPYFALNCAGIAASLMESELFGYEKGAFTGAERRKRGLLELADGGTLLLDEINSAAPEIQARLLQFLQDRTVLRVGGQETVSINVRLVCATNQPLPDLVQAGRFRADLYYRLSAFPVELPALRQRPEDIVPLAELFLTRSAPRLGRETKGFTPTALHCLHTYPWPGNVRELENVVQRALVLARGPRIDVGDLPAELRDRPNANDGRASCTLPADATLAQVEAHWIRQTLERCRGNKSEAARKLGIDVSTLHRKLRA